ncbi:bacterioferritin-associated ferredoxin [Oceanibaculum sp.]|nr:(2Fe-2S)-binding protein [Oceanibaculum sp.]MCH2394993.1 (2Fe-2S)-binding protein [Oceanibaculum sp.]
MIGVRTLKTCPLGTRIAMYVCICNAISERHVRTAIAEGATTAGKVYRACGSQPQCGRCKQSICEMLGEAKAATATLMQPAMAMAGGD